MRILDIGGLIWEGNQRYATIDQALAAAEQALAEWIGENLFDQRGRCPLTCTK